MYFSSDYAEFLNEKNHCFIGSVLSNEEYLDYDLDKKNKRYGLQVYNSVMHIFHFSVPFMMNFMSAVIFIIKQSHQQATIHPQRSYREHLRKQFREHKHLITALIVLAILALPRLIISFV